ncbi:MAG: UDP-N-acetylmuramoyl-L-alanine--D-glutamate ligase, partial [Micromonosporaceae bacterium]|nr:UDP-N-acetylmuramoyl-L-alanine--D-glutamate ligase [Micromonosporaceae bacterium]
GGAGIAGGACARALLGLGAEVTVMDRSDSEQLAALAALGARVVVGDEPDPALLERVGEVVVSPGYPPYHPLVLAARKAGREVYSEPELAWRLRRPGPAGAPPPWLAVTGTNGKTTAVTMLEAVLSAAGLRAAALGNIGEPLVDAVLRPPAEQREVIAVELSSFQLHWSARLAPQAGALLNLADDHLDWHGGFADYAVAKANVWRAPAGVAIGNLDHPRVAALLANAPGRRVGFTLGEPGPGQLGVAGGALVDRAFSDDSAGVELSAADRVSPPGSHNVANALAAAALARAHGVPAAAVRDGLAGYRPAPHRNALVAEVDEVAYVDDSKATNPHAALGSLLAYPRVVWIAGGQLKGVDVDELVTRAADRLVAVVLIGIDRSRVAEALARHAPQVPVRDVARTDDGAMTEAVGAAAAMARPGDTVLLAPAAASFDMFRGYADRGEAFAAAAAGLRAAQG